MTKRTLYRDDGSPAVGDTLIVGPGQPTMTVVGTLPPLDFTITLDPRTGELRIRGGVFQVEEVRIVAISAAGVVTITRPPNAPPSPEGWTIALDAGDPPPTPRSWND